MPPETPKHPRVHGNHLSREALRAINPASAASTRTHRTPSTCPEDHPRGGREHINRTSASVRSWGSSPRAWGPRFEPHQFLRRGRIIPAGAGSTRWPRRRRRHCRDHPRGGGEHVTQAREALAMTGSSPRGRGALTLYGSTFKGDRIIPAGAGSTQPSHRLGAAGPDHPRGGGEHRTGDMATLADLGSSPRGRGAHGRSRKGFAQSRIIPAGAGSTASRRRLGQRSRDHPRGGRGAPTQKRARADRHGIIPAGAGSTDHSPLTTHQRRDHPRGGGEHIANLAKAMESTGSSPRGRGARWLDRRLPLRRGIIPAGAGSTP